MTFEIDGGVTRVVAIRHGQTDWNLAGRIQGHHDQPLNEHGRFQAMRLVAALAGEGLAAIYTSDLARAIGTAAPFAAACGLSVATDPGLRERGFGEFEGLARAEIARRYPEASERWRLRDPTFGAPGGETLADFHARCIAAASRLAARHAGSTIALVAHGGVLDSLYRAATRSALDTPRTWQLANAAINRLLYTPAGFMLLGWDDARHLEGAAAGDAGSADGVPRAANA